MGMYDEIRVMVAEMPERWRARVLQTKELLHITDGGWADDNRFTVKPDRRLVRAESWTDDGVPVDFTGEVFGCDFAPLYDWRMVFDHGWLVDLRGPLDTWVEHVPWDTLPNMVAQCPYTERRPDETICCVRTAGHEGGHHFDWTRP